MTAIHYEGDKAVSEPVTVSSECTDRPKDLWRVIDSNGKIYGKNLSMKRADALFCKLTNPED